MHICDGRYETWNMPHPWHYWLSSQHSQLIWRECVCTKSDLGVLCTQSQTMSLPPKAYFGRRSRGHIYIPLENFLHRKQNVLRSVLQPRHIWECITALTLKTFQRVTHRICSSDIGCRTVLMRCTTLASSEYADNNQLLTNIVNSSCQLVRVGHHLARIY